MLLSGATHTQRTVESDVLSEQKAIKDFRDKIECDYRNVTLGSGSLGGCFGSILCHELHHGGVGDGLHFKALAQKWDISVSFLGKVIADHCDRLCGV